MKKFVRDDGPRRDSRRSGERRSSRDSSSGRGQKRFGHDNSSRTSSGRSDRSRFDRGGSGRSEHQMHRVTCDSCGSTCEVPFRPTGDKPVYCSNCFRKDKGSKNSDQLRKELDQINNKLDKIMEVMKNLQM